MKVVLDLEANALVKPTRIWVICCKDVDTGVEYVFREPTRDNAAGREFLWFAKSVKLWIGHNLLGYDGIVLRDLLGFTGCYVYPGTLDTLVVSKLLDYPRQGHSVEDYGQEFGLEKKKFSDFSKYSLEMEEYCKRDVDITLRIYLKYRKTLENPNTLPSLSLEHSFQFIVNDLSSKGFYFNVKKGKELLSKVEEELRIIDKDILSTFQPRLRLVRTVIPKETKYGTISLSSVPRVLRDLIPDMVAGAGFSFCRWVDFNPSSHKQIIEVLNQAGWKPVDKTQTHIDTEREFNRLKYTKVDSKVKEGYISKLSLLAKTGWKVSEQNLETLPPVLPLELWKNKCRIRIARDENNISEITISLTLTENEQRLAHTTGLMLKELKTDSLEKIMALLLPILKECTNNSPDCVRFAESEKNLWWITATKTEMFVDCSASFVTDTWAGMRDLQTLQQRISQLSSARLLAKRIMLESRRRTLTEWLELVSEDSRIHGKFYGIGAWTHRMAHQKPNTANIPNEFDTNGRRKLYGKELRSLWCAPRNRLLVGVDAEGIQLRIFAHLIDDPEFTRSLVEGRKDEKTDPHSLNQRIIGGVCKSRQAAKRFIYALLLGAGLQKLADILECSRDEAQEALDRLLDRYEGWNRLKRETFPRDAARGYLIGLDGRKIRLPGDTEGTRRHLAMSGYLQAGEAIVMKLATLRFASLLPQDCFLVNFVHDEWQTEVPNNMEVALRVASLQADSLRIVGEELGLKCPLAGSYYNDDLKDYTIGTKWSVTH